MKATDLMIGDWVKIPDKNAPYRRIWAIEYPYNHSVYVDDYGAEDSDENYPIDEIEPIHLTPEILEKNRWINRTDENFSGGHNAVRHTFEGINRWHPARQQETFCLISFDTGDFGLLITGRFQIIKYVHTLQHALRLCELDDLADNFKV